MTEQGAAADTRAATDTSATGTGTGTGGEQTEPAAGRREQPGQAARDNARQVVDEVRALDEDPPPPPR